MDTIYSTYLEKLKDFLLKEKIMLEFSQTTVNGARVGFLSYRVKTSKFINEPQYLNAINYFIEDLSIALNKKKSIPITFEGNNNFPIVNILEIALKLQPNSEQFLTMYNGCLNDLNISYIAKYINDYTLWCDLLKTNILGSVGSTHDNINLAQTIYGNISNLDITVKQFPDRVVEIGDAVKCFLQNHREILSLKEANNVSVDIINSIKGAFPEHYWNEFSPYLPCLPQKTEELGDLFACTKPVIELFLPWQQLYNRYHKLSSHEDMEFCLDATLNALENFAQQKKLGISFFQLSPIEDKENYRLLVGSDTTSFPVEKDIKKYLEFLFDLFHTNYATKNNYTPQSKEIGKILGVGLDYFWLDMQLAKKTESKIKKNKI